MVSDTPLTCRLNDGRQLAYAEFGTPTGHPLLFFHGGNDSRLEAALLDAGAQELGVRVVAPDRPGYGGSSPQAERTLGQWPADVEQLADQLELERFAVFGHSGGGPHAAAVAHALPQRVVTTTMVSSPAPPPSSNRGMHPMFRMVNFLMGHSPVLHRALTRQMSQQIVTAPDKFFLQWSRMSAADGRLFGEQRDVVELVAAEMAEAVQQGIEGILAEHPLYKRPWGFSLKEIGTPVHIWHGLADRQAAPAWSEALVAQLPNAIPHFLADEGHFSVLVNHHRQMLTDAIGLH